MNINLKGFTALITGGSSGMGFEMAKELLAHRATVIITAIAGEKLDNAYKQLSENGNDVYAIPMDIRDENSVNAAVDWFKKHFVHLDMLVNNAEIGDTEDIR